MNVLLAIGLFFGFTVSLATAPSPLSTHSLDLQIIPEQIEDGVPQVFSFLLTNRSNHELRVPVPIVDCGGTYTGSIWLRLHFVPLTPGQGGGSYGCAADKVGWPPILQRVQKWKVLQPGESLTVHADKAHRFFADHDPGSYEFWADYEPPSVSPEDQDKLRAEQIDFPHERLTSQHVNFTESQ